LFLQLLTSNDLKVGTHARDIELPGEDRASAAPVVVRRRGQGGPGVRGRIVAVTVAAELLKTLASENVESPATSSANRRDDT
jgi:hypothetical protein